MHFEMSDLFPLVKELSESYTRKDSTSVSYEKAAQLMEGILYCIAEEEREGNVQEIMVTQNRQDNISLARQIYELGHKRVIEKVMLAKQLYNKEIVDFNSFGNNIYEDTVTKAIPGFFKWYDAKFFPQESILTFDYPILLPLEKQSGIDAIYEYIKSIFQEQEFLRKIPDMYIREVLNLLYEDFQELVINLCSPVLKKLLSHCLIGLPLQKIEIDKEEYQKAICFIQGENKETLCEKLNLCLKQIIKEIYDGNEILFAYLKSGIPDIATELINGAKHGCMESII